MSAHLIHAATRWDGVAELESGNLTIQTIESDVLLVEENFRMNINFDAGLDVCIDIVAAWCGSCVVRNGVQFVGPC